MTGFMKIAVLAAVVGLLFGSAALAQDYEIRLNRPMKVGQQYQVSATGRESQKATVSVNSQLIKNEVQETVFEVTAGVRVIEVDKNGTPSKASLRIGKCESLKGDVRTPLVPPGAVVIASVGGNGPLFEIDGRKVTPDAQRTLSQVFALGKGGPGYDQMFGASQPKKVGESWPMNLQLVAEDAKLNGADLKKEDLSGSVTLEKVVQVGDTKCLQVGVALNIARLAPPAPPGLVVDKATAQSRTSGKFPIDPALGVPERSEVMSLSVVMKGVKPQPDAPDLIVETTAERQTTIRYAYLKN